MNETFRAKVLHKTQVTKAALVSSTTGHSPQKSSSSSSKTDPLMVTSLKNPSSLQEKFDIPTGRWRDGIFDCCIMPLHPVFFATYCFPLITLGQVMTRIKYNICGGAYCCGGGASSSAAAANGHSRQSKIYPRAFYVMFAVTVVKLVFFSNIGDNLKMIFYMYSGAGMGSDYYTENAYNPYSYSGSSGSSSGWYEDEEWQSFFNSTEFEDDFYEQWFNNNDPYSQTSGTNVSASVYLGIYRLLAMALSIFILVVHTTTRNRIRRAYSIGDDMSCLGDCCCAWWCSVCSICQMARHTANYHTTHRARCCTPNGLDEEWDDFDFLPVTTTQHDNPHSSRSTLPIMV